jgi:hypothetical protein
VTSTPHVDLPSREDLKRAIRPWWSGGGTAEVLVDLLRREEAELDEARELAAKVAELTDKGYRVGPDMAASIFADQRSAIERRRREEGNVKATPSQKYRGLSWHPKRGWIWTAGKPPFNVDIDTEHCVFGDGVRCPNCGQVHGHLLTKQEPTDRIGEVRALLMARLEEAGLEEAGEE